MIDDVYKVFDYQLAKTPLKYGFVFYCSAVEDSCGKFNHSIQRAVVEVNNRAQIEETINTILSECSYAGADSDASPHFPLFVSNHTVSYLTNDEAFDYVWRKIISNNTKVTKSDDVYVDEKLRFVYKIRAGANTESKECSGSESTMRDFVNALLRTQTVMKHPLIDGVIFTLKENP